MGQDLKIRGDIMDIKKINFINRITDVWDYPKLSIYSNDVDENYFDFLKNDGNQKNREIRLYIHTPFCQSFCYFCQFYKEPVPRNKEEIGEYVQALIKELEIYSESEYLKNCIITSIFFGGGDPAVLDVEYFEKIIDFITSHYKVSSDVSITLEGNILNLLNKEKIASYKRNNVSRISFGIQTFDEELRKKLLIKPKIKDIYNLIDLLKQCNIPNYTFDLMYNLPDQTMDILKNDLECANKIDSQYIDLYSLNIYPNTVFYDAIYTEKKFSILPDKSKEGEMVRYINDFMDSNNYNQVLSVTYSKTEKLPHKGLYHYLKGGEMLGVGPSARSFLANRGYRNVCSIEKYISSIKENKLPVETGRVLNEGEIETRNTVLFPTLLQADCNKISKRSDITDRINELINSGYIYMNDDKLSVSTEGRNWIGNIQKHLYDSNYSEEEFKNFLTTIKNKRSAYNQDLMWIKKK